MTPFIQHVQNVADAPGRWPDEFLAWYKPDLWETENRAAAVFIGEKIAALLAENKRLRAQVAPAELGPLAKRNVFDAIRSAYDLGYNDARNARAVPGDGAPGYQGRDVEADHGSALFNTLNRRLSTSPAAPAQQAGQAPAPAPEPVAWIEHDWSGSGARRLHFERRPETVRDEVVNPVWTPLYAAPVQAPAVGADDARDAARYRFIRDADRSDHTLDFGSLMGLSMYSMDAAIDWAMSRESDVPAQEPTHD